MKRNASKDAKAVSKPVRRSIRQAMKVEYTVHSSNAPAKKRAKSVKSQPKEESKKDKPLTKSSKPSLCKQPPLSLIDALRSVDKEYLLKSEHWTVLFKEKVIDNVSFSFDAGLLSVKSLNEAASEVIVNETFWILLIDYYIKVYSVEAKGNSEDTSVLRASVIKLFDEAFNYINEPQSIVKFYYDTINTLSPQLKQKEMLALLNANSLYVFKHNPPSPKGKKPGRLLKENDREGHIAHSHEQEIEYIPSEKVRRSPLDDLIQMKDDISEDILAPLDEKCLSTICNASATIEYQNWQSPHLMHIREEDSEERNEEPQESTEELSNGNGLNSVADHSHINEEILPLYEQRKLQKVKELMQEIEAKCGNASLDTLSSPFGKKRVGTPSKHFSSKEEYPLDLVEGSIQKFNQSVSKNDLNK